MPLRVGMAADSDYPSLYALSGFHPTPETGEIGFPTIVAKDEVTGEIAGFIASRVDADRITARNLWAPGRARLAAKLVTIYERYLLSLGITSYYFIVSRRQPQMYAVATHLEQEGLAERIGQSEDDNAIAYIRRIGG